MGGDVFDVVVLGPVEATPAAAARLSAALARSQGLPVAAVVRAMQEKNLRLGTGLERAAADRMVAELQALGALTTLRRSTAALAAVNIPTPLHGFPAAGGGHTLQGLGSSAASAPAAPTLTPLGGGSGLRGLATLSPSAPSPSLRPLGNLRPEPPPAFAPPPGPPDAPGMDTPSAVSSFALPEAPRGPDGGNPFSVPDEAEQALELDIKPRGQDHEASPHPSHSLAGASALNTSKITNTSSASGLTTHQEDGQEDTVRCPTHGLLYDRRKNTGCRRCLEAKRSATRGNDRPAAAGRSASPARPRQPSWTSSLSPARRAFLGLALAMGLGFGSAAYYTHGPVAANVDRLRAEQTALSARPGTQENLARFDQIDADVNRARGRGLRNSLILWVAISGVLMAGWYRVTA